jgi:hypothetical protein
MPRRMIFPLRRCPGLVPIPELDDDIVILVVERTRTLIGRVVPAAPSDQSQCSTSAGVDAHGCRRAS